MLVIHCSTRLLKDLDGPVEPEHDTPESRLGEWYATVLQMRPHPVVLMVNAPSRLPVLVATRDFVLPGKAVAEAILHVIADLGTDADVMEHERSAMSVVGFARAMNRGITSAINEITDQLEQLREVRTRMTAHAQSLELSKRPIAIPGHGRARPADVARRLLSGS